MAARGGSRGGRGRRPQRPTKGDKRPGGGKKAPDDPPAPGGAGAGTTKALHSEPRLRLSATAAEFVPGSVAGASDEHRPRQEQAAWAWGNHGNWSGGPAPVWQQLAGLQQGAVACWFNAEAYSTDASEGSSPCGSPRGPVANGVGTGSPDDCPERSEEVGGTTDEPAIGCMASTVASLEEAPEAPTPLPSAPAQGLAAARAQPAADSDHPPLSESDGEWSLPSAATPHQPDQQDARSSIATVVEMSERVLKFWLQRFANDGDSEALALQWRVWTENDPSSATRAVDWLLRRGLEDCRCAKPVTAVLEQLLRCEGLGPEIPQRCFSEFSDEDLEDIALDNPKVGEFVADIRLVLAAGGVRKAAEASPCEPAAAGRPLEHGRAAASAGAAAAAYCRAELLEVRRALLLEPTSATPEGLPRWGTAAAAAVAPPAPRWEEQMARREQRDAEGGGRKRSSAGPAPSSSSGDWRRDQHRHSETRGGREPCRLQAGELSWVAQMKRLKEQSAASDKDAAEEADFLREMRLTLNKLTIEKFDQLSEKIIDTISRSTRPNRGVPTLMQLVFEKATTQHHFINMYVSLCMKLHTWFTVNEHVMAMELQNNFRRILLNQCQSSFEQYLEPPEGLEGLQGTELYEAQVKYKTKMLGNIRLVGELIKHGMLEREVALAVARELALPEPAVREERLETLAVFLETVGPTLDDSKWASFGELNAIFGELQRLVNVTEVSCRTRFLLRDVLDLRRGRWRARRPRDLEREAPSTLAEVQQRAQQAASPWPEPPARPGRGEAQRRAGRRGEASSASFVGTSSACSSATPSPQLRAAPSPQLKAAPSPTLRAAPGPQLRAAPSLQPPGSQRTTGPGQDPATQAPGAGPPPPLPPAGGGGGREAPAQPACFHRELAQTLRQLGAGLDVPAAAQRLLACARPGGYGPEEAADLLARIADEPRSRRQQLLPLLPALFAVGVFTPAGGLARAVEAFTRDAFIDPGGTDPPDLADIVLREMLPSLGLAAGALELPACLRELLDCCCVDDGG